MSGVKKNIRKQHDSNFFPEYVLDFISEVVQDLNPSLVLEAK